MKAVVYYRQPQDPAVIGREMDVQRASVAAWVAENDATVVAEFTETETGTQSRPAFGQARRATIQENATLVVATTKAFTAGTAFVPMDSYDGPAIVRLVDPAERDRELWERSQKLVVYYRQLSVQEDSAGAAAIDAGGPHIPLDNFAVASRRSLEKQRDGVALIAHPDVHTIIATFTEIETARADDDAQVRPQLETALNLCRRERARIVIGTTDAIGPAPAFEPDTGEVPTEIAWRSADAFDAILDAPQDAASPFIGLHIGRRYVRNRRPLYLANRTGDDLVAVTIRRTGWTYAYGDLTELEPSESALDHVADGTSRLAGDYDVFFLSDFTVTWTIEARNARGHLFRGTMTVEKGAPAGRLIAARNWQPVDLETTKAG